MDPLATWVSLGDLAQPTVPPTEWRNPRTWLFHLSLCATLGLVYAIWIAFLQEVLRPFGSSGLQTPFLAISVAYFISRLNLALLIYVVIVALTHTLDARAGLSERETEAATVNAQLAHAELEALRRQLEPHFLFNTLNAIAGLLRENRVPAAITAIARLGDLLRNVLDSSDKQFVSLAFLPLAALPFTLGLQVFTGAMGEELGWRGFLLTHLERTFSPRVAALVMAISRAIWHFPAFFFPGMPQQHMPPMAFVLMVAAVGIFLALLFNRTRGHVVSTMLAHFSFNMGLAVGAILGSVFIWALAFIFSSLAIFGLAKLLRGPSA